MANKEMTQREFFTAVSNGTVTEEIKTYAVNAIKKLDEKNERRKGENSKTAKANKPIKEAIIAYFNDNPNLIATAKQVADKQEISTQKASALLRQIVETGVLKVDDIKDEKKNKVKGYSLAK